MLTSRRSILLGCVAAGFASQAEALASGAPAGNGSVVDIADAAALMAMVNAGVQASGGKTYRLAANTDFGTPAIHNCDFRSNPITIVGQPGARFQWLDFANAHGMTWKTFNAYGGQPGVVDAAVAMHDGCSDMSFDGVTVLTGAPEGKPADGCGWFFRNCGDANITIKGQRDASKPDVSGKGNAINVSDSGGVLLNDLTITNHGVDGILLAGADGVTIDGCFGMNFYCREGDHPDFIQGFNAFDHTPIRNITIKNCGWERGIGSSAANGYFFEDVHNLTVQGCWSYGASFNSIGIARGDTVLFDDNYFVGFRDYGSTVVVRGGTANAKVTKNHAGSVNFYGPEGPYRDAVESGNKLIGSVKAGDFGGLDGWLAKHPNARARV